MSDTPAPHTAPLLSAHHLHHRFGDLHAVADVSLELHTGEVHALIGPNGAGKTTLLNLISGLHRPARGGRIVLDGTRLQGRRPWRIARAGLGRSFQRGRLFLEMTAEENVRFAVRGLAFGRRLSFGDGGTGALAQAHRALALVGLGGRETALALRLSHGERRLLELAMAFAGGAKVLLLDEPLAGLGTGESEATIACIRTLAEGRAILMIEHDLDAVFRIASRVTVLVGGRAIASGTPLEVQADAAVRAAYLPEEESDG